MKKVKIGKCKLYKADCFDIIKELPDSSVDLIVTDPPYNLIDCGNGGGSIGKAGKLNSIGDINNDKNLANSYNIVKYNKEFVRVMKGINIYIWCNKIQIPDYFKFYVLKRKCKFDILCWHKLNAIPAYFGKYLSDTEYCLHFFRDRYGAKPKTYENAKTYFLDSINQKDKKKYNHPTIKPLYMIERLIKNSSKKNDVILDPFMGSGTTGVACQKLKRKFLGIEINKKYFRICKKRIKEEIHRIKSPFE